MGGGEGGDLVRAWGPGGQWVEDKGGVFAPEEVFFATMLALLGYLRDPPPSLLASLSSSSSSSSSTPSIPPIPPPPPSDQVCRLSVTYAEWRRAGDANPIVFPALTPALLLKMRASGALFARKFAAGSLTVEDWKRVVCGVEGGVGVGVGRGVNDEGVPSLPAKRLRSEDEEADASTADETHMDKK